MRGGAASRDQIRFGKADVQSVCSYIIHISAGYGYRALAKPLTLAEWYKLANGLLDD